MIDCAPDGYVQGAVLFLVLLFECWIGKTKRTAAASSLEFLWLFAVGIFSVVALLFSLMKKGNDDVS